MNSERDQFGRIIHCASCDEELLIRFLRPGELAACKACGHRTAVPDSESQLLAKREQSTPAVCTDDPSASEAAVTSATKVLRQAWGITLFGIFSQCALNGVLVWYAVTTLSAAETPGLVVVSLAMLVATVATIGLQLWLGVRSASAGRLLWGRLALMSVSAQFLAAIFGILCMSFVWSGWALMVSVNGLIWATGTLKDAQMRPIAGQCVLYTEAGQET